MSSGPAVAWCAPFIFLVVDGSTIHGGPVDVTVWLIGDAWCAELV